MSGSRVEALIFAGGTGTRMGSTARPKQFLELAGRPIIDFTIEQFATHPLVTGVVVVCLRDWLDYMEGIIADRSYPVPVEVVPGGATGQESIFLGLSHLRDAHAGDYDAVVLVHDGVRPLIDEDTITRCIRSIVEHGPTATVAPSQETVIVTGIGGVVERVLDRSSCELARAPQGFRTEELYAAHLRAQDEGRGDFIDSVSMMAAYGYKIHTVEGPAENIKVTTPVDYFAFRGYMEARDLRELWGESA